ncbi:MAG: transcription termination factor NusA [Albidovulum sp.]|nr:transcription termination factor NusA [Albidovulum sp.]
MSAASANRLELLQIADSVAQEKMIDQEIVVNAMEEAWAKAAKYQYGPEFDIRATIDRRTGDMLLRRVRTVSENPENHALEIDIDNARENNPEASVGDEIAEDLPPLELGRIAAQNAKQVMLQLVRDAERERQYEEFKDRKGTIVNGIVRREEYGNIVLDIGRGEAVLRREQKIGRENYQRDDRLRAYISDVRREQRGPQIFLSRTAPEFMVELFRLEVPEIYEEIIEIKAVARDPGSRAKIAVVSHDSSIDPVGACVGMRGSRVQAVVNELQGERIDIIPWTENSVELIVSALQPAKVARVILDEEGLPSEVVVPEDQLSLAIGRRGQNVRLACQLTGLDISIMTEAQEMERRQADVAERTAILMEAIDVDQVFAHLLVSEGFDSIEYLAACDVEELLEIEGIDLGIAEEVQNRAIAHIEQENRKSLDRARELGVEIALEEFDGLSPKMIETLAEEGILTLEEFAACADWELAGGYVMEGGKRKKDDGILENCDITLEEARLLVMSARVAVGIIDTAELEAVIADDDNFNSESGDESME